MASEASAKPEFVAMHLQATFAIAGEKHTFQQAIAGPHAEKIQEAWMQILALVLKTERRAREARREA